MPFRSVPIYKRLINLYAPLGVGRWSKKYAYERGAIFMSKINIYLFLRCLNNSINNIKKQKAEIKGEICRNV